MSGRSRLRGSTWLVLIGLLAVLFSYVQAASAHEVRPAYLQIDEIGPNRYSVLWRTPLLSGMRLPVVLTFPEGVRNVTEPTLRELPDSLVERRLIEAPDGLDGKKIEFTGLQATITDVLVQGHRLDGGRATAIVRPSQPWFVLPAHQSGWSIAWEYLTLGIEHILYGLDHLLFVASLMLIVRDWRVLVKTITAFTIAHSVTLALATFGLVTLPSAPVEAMIALSILLVAAEAVRMERGETSLTITWPWVVAFAFGLLHGFGFAGAMVDLGLPQRDIPLALFAFNVGVEIGQLMFIAAILLVVRSTRLVFAVGRPARIAAAYGIGCIAAFWTVERLDAIVL